MNSSAFKYDSSNLQYDLTAGIVVFLVAIPLCLGIALASGAPLFSGIVSGILGGIVVGLLSESSVSVSGPAAGMVAVVVGAITALGGFHGFLLALFLAGFLQILIGTLRAGFIADYIPSNVIQGLLCAIGLLIIIKQIPFLLTYTDSNKELLILLKDISGSFDVGKLDHIWEHINFGALAIGLISFGVLIYFDKTKNPFAKKIPGPIVVVIAGTLINTLFSYGFNGFAQESTELVNIPVSDSIESFIRNFQHPDWSLWRNPDVYLYAVVLAAVGSLEALLNLEGIEKLDKNHRYCNRNRELVAQGVGNTISGLIGGLPITSVIVRSSVNINSGAKTKLSTIFHGLLIFFVAFFIPHWMNEIPLAALAAILIHVGFKLTHPKIYKSMQKEGASRYLPFIVTILAIITTNLLTGVIVGLLVSFFFILKDNSLIQLDIINEKYPSGDVKRLVLPEHMSFLRKAALVAELDLIPDGDRLTIDGRFAKYIDRDILEVLNVFKTDQAPQKNIALNMVGFKERYELHDHIEFVNVTNYDTQAGLKPQDVLQILQEGNQRFVNDKPIHRYVPNEVKASSLLQYPLAIILGCIDSRVPVESIFDMGFGDVFVSRVAGNVINEDIIGSVEFACDISGAKLIVILGHTHCGAIKAACSQGGAGSVKQLLSKIQTAIDAETTTKENRNGDNEDFVTKVVKLNVVHSKQDILNASAPIRKLVEEGKVAIVGATYDIHTGVVSFY